MESQQAYNNYISNILNTRGRFNCVGYKERHHITPKCLGGDNTVDNLIDLYAEEHYIAHKLLALEQPDNKSLLSAWLMMAYPKSSTQQRNYEISPEDYAYLRKQWAYHMSVANPGLDENGHPWNYGVPMSEEQKIKVSKSKTGVLLGPNSEETKLKKSLAARKRYREHPETFGASVRNKKCITNRKIENKSYGSTTIKRFKYVIDNLVWGYKDENKIY